MAIADVTISSNLKGHDGGGLESEVPLEMVRHFSAQPLERQLPHQQVRRLLVLADVTECIRARGIPLLSRDR